MSARALIVLRFGQQEREPRADLFGLRNLYQEPPNALARYAVAGVDAAIQEGSAL
jgi:hypothetical protein